MSRQATSDGFPPDRFARGLGLGWAAVDFVGENDVAEMASWVVLLNIIHVLLGSDAGGLAGWASGTRAGLAARSDSAILTPMVWTINPKAHIPAGTRHSVRLGRYSTSSCRG